MHQTSQVGAMMEEAEIEAWRFARLLEEARRQRGWSQREAARQCDLHHTHVHKIEHGLIGNPSIETLIKLSNGYGIPVWYLLAALLPGLDGPTDYVLGRAVHDPTALRALAKRVARTPRVLAAILREAGLRLDDEEDWGTLEP